VLPHESDFSHIDHSKLDNSIRTARQEEQGPMSLFKCQKCGCGEDTLCHYWSARLRETAPMCSACDPKVGRWHGEFPREPFAVRHKLEFERLLERPWVNHS
jgi:hypothetical protein